MAKAVDTGPCDLLIWIDTDSRASVLHVKNLQKSSLTDLPVIERLKRIRLVYVVLAVLLLVGLLPLSVAGVLLSRRSADELRSIEGRYQAQLVRDKARQIELYGQRYREVVIGLARAFEITGGNQLAADSGYDARLQKSLQDDPNLIALAICPVRGEVHRAFQFDLIKRKESGQRINDAGA